MKKCFFLTVCLFSFACSLYAQPRIALTGGGHSASVDEKNDLPGFDTYSKDYSSRKGFHFGIVADIPLNTPRLSFQPGIQFYNKGRKYFSADSASTNIQSTTKNQYINYIDLPLNLVLKLPLSTKTRFILGAGPYLGAFYNGKEYRETYYKNGVFESEENADLPIGNDKGKYAVINYGISALAGFEFGRIFLTANASKGLNDFYKAPDYDGTFRHQVIGGTLGIFLGQNPVAAPPKDSDGDGIPDKQDACPSQAGPAITKGCPDMDNDGVADKDDSCPDVPGFIKYKGCPVPDTDQDGVNDEQDKCPQTAGSAKNQGCPVPDSDKDGVDDEQDKCPNVPGLAKYNGCPVPDTDGDGINDDEDRCPQTFGIQRNMGCPEITKEITEKVSKAARQIQFNYQSSQLTSASYSVLDEVADLLKKDPSLKLTIEGHTSNDGDPGANKILSQQRAMAVKNYIISKNIGSHRLTAIGYGASKPLTKGTTKSEKAQNRRVELKLSN